MNANLAYDPNVTAGVLQRSLDELIGAGKVYVTVGWRGPQYDTYTCDAGYVRVEKIEQLARTLANAAHAPSCRISMDGGLLLLEVPKPEPLRQVLYADRLEEFKAASPTAVPIGVTMGGSLVWLDLADERMAHVLLGGASGTGKSVLTKYILMRLLRQNRPAELRLLVADPKVRNREGLLPFVHSGHLLHPIQTDTFEVWRLLQWVKDEMKRRELTNDTKTRLLVVIEEVAHFTDEDRRIAPLLKHIAQIGRSWNVNLLLTTQDPGVASVGPAIANVKCTIMGRVARETQQYGATGRKKTYASELLERGDLILLAAGKTVHFQAPYATNDWIWRRIWKGGPYSLEGQLPPADLVDTGVVRSGTLGREISREDVERVRGAVLAGRGVEYVRQTLRIGTDKARLLHADIREGKR